MACCSIRWCGKNSKTSNFKKDGITFHRFPKNPEIKEKWMDITKRENWFPTEFSVVCSRHFTEDCFYTVKDRRRLFKTAIPTQHLPLVFDESGADERAPENSSPNPSSSSQFEPKSTAMTTKRKSVDHDTLSQLNEVTTKKRLIRRILDLKKLLTEKNETIKVLQGKVRYYKKRAESLKVELDQKTVI
ncbi:THAP domain-containing protein 1-like [Leguminivora glycinivorella]|uniref:THAP domain-containing protein 1-like n=1 Tax=Leguminivora glycinivorella TaxID=1035111 RepID=UPI00200CD431|nr:THAP domain-containing protein 1-like [Leguminivora glycinivorella]